MGNPFAAAAARVNGHISATDGLTTFRGASGGRLYSDWLVQGLSPDRELYGNLPLLRWHARELKRNNDFASAFVRELANNIVGPEGITVEPQIRDDEGELLVEIGRAIKAGWKDWGRRENASVDGQDSWMELQRLGIETIATDGEVIARHRKGFEQSAHGYALQLIDPDLLDDTYNVPPNGDGVEIRMGVERDANGRPLAYHFFRTHPQDMWPDQRRVRVPAAEIIHLFIRYRPGQTRGVTWFAPVLTRFHHFDGLTEAELVASRLHASKMGFITNNTPEAIEAYAARIRGGKTKPADLDIAPGIIDELEPGQGFEGFDPQHPNTALEAFSKIILRGIARGVGISYSSLTGDLTDANYGSQRAGLLPERDFYRIIQHWFAAGWHDPVYRAWLPMALLRRTIALPLEASRIPSDYWAVDWRGRGWKWIDPKNDSEATERDLMLGLTSRTRICAERDGSVWREIVDELAGEVEYAAQKGVYIDGVAKKAAPSQPADAGGAHGEESTPTRGALRACD